MTFSHCFGSGLIDSGSGSSILGWIPTRIRIQGWPKNENNLQLKKIIIFDSKVAIYLSLGLHKGRPSYRRSLQPSKENIQHFKTWNFLTFSLFMWVIFPSFGPPGSRFWIRIHWSHWIRIQSGFGSKATNCLYRPYYYSSNLRWMRICRDPEWAAVRTWHNSCPHSCTTATAQYH